MENPNAGSPADVPSGEQTQTQGGNVTDLQKQLEQAIAERQKANAEAAEYRLKEKARLEKEQAEQGKFAELTVTLQKERDEANAKAAALEAAVAEKQAKLQAIETNRKNELLAKLPEGIRATYATFDLTVLEQISKDFTNIAPGSSQGADRGAGQSTPPPPPPQLPNVPFAGVDAVAINKLTEYLNNRG